ncbi:MAG: UDP-N-acetylglucosamine 1-carboxyvinyltransferase [Oscillospiraceae bacterium]|nr:UDP-N-acetylglucosamine 1-carboxyvinyltransferase [Oscillospiraceae bacterium]
MRVITVEGGRALRGELTVQGAKNSVLPILAASIMARDVSVIENCPRLEDVDASADILRHLGCRVCRVGEDLEVDSSGLNRWDVPDHLMRRMRSSVIFLGAILTRCGRAELSYPGGCELGPRPIDLHLSALRTLGVRIDERFGRMRCLCQGLRGTEIVLSLPSVGATENAMLAACGARGVTVISNAAREPEIVDLQDFLCKMGASVRGAGTSTVIVEGGKPLHGCRHRCIGDRIAAATYLSAVAATGGNITLKGVDYRHLSTVTTALAQAGCRISSDEQHIRLRSSGQLRGVCPIHTSPYPGFPTDAQAVVMAALLRSAGTTVFVENIFQNRYRHVAELQRMGANIRLEGRVAVLCGVPRLCGASVHCTDLRGGAALVLAGLQADGVTRVEEIHHIKRGYSDLTGDLARLGAGIQEIEV